MYIDVVFILTGLRYPFMLTKGGYAMTFPLDMENASRSLDSESTAGELAKSGQDSAKINLRSVAYKYMPSLPLLILINVRGT